MIDATTKVFSQSRAFSRTIALPQEGIIGRSEVVSLALPKAWKNLLVLLFLVLFSALSLVYVKDLNRRLFANHQQLQKDFVQLQTESNSLLLEESAWANQNRIQQVAEKQFDMTLPQIKSIVLLKVS